MALTFSRGPHLRQRPSPLSDHRQRPSPPSDYRLTPSPDAQSQNTADYGPSDLRRLLWSFRPPSTDNGLSDPGLLPTTVLSICVTYYGLLFPFSTVRCSSTSPLAGRALNASLNNFFASFDDVPSCRIRNHTPIVCSIGSKEDDGNLLVAKFMALVGTGNDRGRSNVLLVVAHPDDESMFFAPTILYLTSNGHNLYILCISNGNSEGKGNIRKEELYRACATLKVPLQQIKVVDHQDLQCGAYGILVELELKFVRKALCEGEISLEMCIRKWLIEENILIKSHQHPHHNLIPSKPLAAPFLFLLPPLEASIAHSI
ncbi:hypothetical protein KFK09_003418 [Dendrobium nobile]|uniref:N-acetylglucosaminylphosphatidylinositol deacetylase n=1 Tax=Dendrobium nobile TaxID=94219 RepID=A0A8T3C075_DENNO|nr:hypothetical protein KFK09_003418 [Dendrobium nobile]